MTDRPENLLRVYDDRKICAVPGCDNSEASSPELHFFPFPSNSERCLQWLMMCDRRDLTSQTVDKLNANFSICAIHFAPNSFVKHHKKLLKSSSVPTLFVKKENHTFQNGDKTLRSDCKQSVSVFLQEDNSFDGADLDDTFFIENDLPSTRAVDIVIEDSQFTLCRLCSESNLENQNMINIFEESNISARINLCLPLTVSSEDVLPKNICFPCNERLQKHFEFHQIVVESDKVLKDMFEDFTRNTEEEKRVKEKTINHNLLVNSVCDDNIYTEVILEKSISHSLLAEVSHFNISLADDQNDISHKVDSISTDKFVNNEDVIVETAESVSETLNNNLLVNSVCDNNIYTEVILEESNSHSLLAEASHLNISSLTDDQNDTSYNVDSISTDKFVYSEDIIVETAESVSGDIQVSIDTTKTEVDMNAYNFVDYSYDDGNIVLEDATNMFVCNICNGLALDLDSMYSHSIISHTTADGTYVCVLCDVADFTAEKELLNHMQLHQFSTMETSNINECLVKPESNLVHEMKDVDKNKKTQRQLLKASAGRIQRNSVFNCSFCNKKFKSKHRMDFHLKFHLGEEPGLCTYCDKRFPGENHLYRHISYNHRREGGSCCFCNRPFKSSTKKLYHEETRHGVQRTCLQCQYCCQAFGISSELYNHILAEHTEAAVVIENIELININRLYQCEFCFKLYTKTSALKTHRLTYHSDSQKFTCRFCEESLMTHEDLLRHIQASSKHQISHRKEDYPERPVARKLFCCHYCSRMFQTLNSLMDHVLRHNEGNIVKATSHSEQKPDDNRPYKCTYCPKDFHSKGTLIKHIRIHTGEKPFGCDICGKSFNQASGLTIHRKMHTDERPFGCAQCSQTFKIKGDRDKHQRKHSGERPFECPTCHKTFMTQHVYSQHCKIHTNHRPYVCSVCGDAFRRSHVLQVHALRHSGEKPHGCSQCDKQYRQRGDLLKHLKTQHGITTSTITNQS